MKINKVEKRKTREKVIKDKSWCIEKSNKIDKTFC